MAEELYSTVKAVVHRIDGEFAHVEIEQGGCGRCHEEGGCGGQQLTQMFCSGPKQYQVKCIANLKAGDHVTIAIASGSIRKSANLAYGLPIFALIAGALVGNLLWSDVGGIACGLLGLVGSFSIIRYRLTGNPLPLPHIVSRS